MQRADTSVLRDSACFGRSLFSACLGHGFFPCLFILFGRATEVGQWWAGLGMIKPPIFGSDFRKGSGGGFFLTMSHDFCLLTRFTHFYTFLHILTSLHIYHIACILMKFSRWISPTSTCCPSAWRGAMQLPVHPVAVLARPSDEANTIRHRL
jgi:hypothetical protein